MYRVRAGAGEGEGQGSSPGSVWRAGGKQDWDDPEQDQAGGGGGRGGLGTEGTAKRGPPESVLVSFQHQTHSPLARTTFPIHQVPHHAWVTSCILGKQPSLLSGADAEQATGTEAGKAVAQRGVRPGAGGPGALGWVDLAGFMGGGPAAKPRLPPGCTDARTQAARPSRPESTGCAAASFCLPCRAEPTQRRRATPCRAPGPQSQEGPPGPLRLRRTSGPGRFHHRKS